MLRGKYERKAKQDSHWSKNIFTEFWQAACVRLSNELFAISAWEGWQDGSLYIDQSRTIFPARGSTETRSAASWIYIIPSISSRALQNSRWTTYNSPSEISWHCTPSNFQASDPEVPSDSNTDWAKDSEDEEWARNPTSRAFWFLSSVPFTKRGRLTSAVPFKHTHCVTGRWKSPKGRGL